MIGFRRLSLVVLVFTSAVPALAQDKKEKPKEPPKPIMATPMTAPLGAVTKLSLRGLRLDDATEVRALEPEAAVKVTGKGKMQVTNNQEASLVGDSHVNVELTLPAELPDPTVTLIVVTPAGESQPLRVLVDPASPLPREKEPNAGFKQATPVTSPSEVLGEISQNQDVDVYRYEGKAGETVVFDILAARLGAATDASLTLFDENGRILVVVDDRPLTPEADPRDSRDPLLKYKLPSAGVYFVSVSEANDQGGAAYPYRLVVRSE